MASLVPLAATSIIGDIGGGIGSAVGWTWNHTGAGWVWDHTGGALLGEAGDAVVQGLTSLYTGAMLAIWGAGQYIFRLVLGLCDMFLTPDLTATGSAHTAYAYAGWLALALATLFIFVQLGVAAVQMRAGSLATAFVGSIKFVVITLLWITYAVAVVAAAAGISKGLNEAMLGQAGFAKVNLWNDGVSAQDAITATVLAFCGIFLALSSLGIVFIYIARSASLVILVVTAPISAAGQIADFGKSWFWKTFRWFHAAALTPVLMSLILGTGVSIISGTFTKPPVKKGDPWWLQQLTIIGSEITHAVPSVVTGVVIVCMCAVAPMGLFRLLAFIDPGTASGAAMRQGLAAQGGVKGLLTGFSGGGASQQGAGSAASPASEPGQSGGTQGEDQASAANSGRFQQVLGSLGGIGNALSSVASLGNRIGTGALAMQSDLDNQAGVGSPSHYPEFSNVNQQSRQSQPTPSSQPQQQQPEPPITPDQVMPAPGPTPLVSWGPTGASGGGAGGSSAGGGAAAAGEIPPIV